MNSNGSLSERYDFSFLPNDVLFGIEIQLSIQDILILGQVNKRWCARLTQSHWRLIFIARWSKEYREEDEDFGDAALSFCNARIGKRIWGLAGNNCHTFASWRSFWRNIENGFIGQDVPNNTTYHAGGSDNIYHHTKIVQYLVKIFSLFQPPGQSKKSAYKYIKMDTFKNTYPENNRDGYVEQAPPWRLACLLRERQGSDVLRCRICNEVDVLTNEMRDWESLPTQCSSWVAPCQCSSLVHRICLEQKAKEANTNPQIAHVRDWISFEDYRVLRGDEYERIRCPKCMYQYTIGWRLPGSFKELARVTMEDRAAWTRAASSILYWGILVCFVHTLEQHYGKSYVRPNAFGIVWPQPGGFWLAWWLLQQVVLLQIFFSPRFVQVVGRLWRGPIFCFYCKLYIYFVFACWAFPATWSPALTRLLPAFLISLGYGSKHDAQDSMELPFWLVLLGWLNALVYLGVSSVVVFLFWKTNYRVRTVSDPRQNTTSLHPIMYLNVY